MTPCITVYRHRAWHPTLSQYTDHDTLYQSIQTQGMAPYPVTIYRYRSWHPVSQYTDTGHGTLPCHSIQIMTPCIKVYIHRAWHPTLLQYIDTGHDTLYQSIQTQGMTPYPVTVYRSWHPVSQYTDTGHGTLYHSMQTQGMTPYPVTYRSWHPVSQYTDRGHNTLLHQSHTYGPQNYIWRPWLIVLVNLWYSFNVHARLPLCMAINEHCEEPRCSFQTRERKSLIGCYMVKISVLTYRFSWHNQTRPLCISSLFWVGVCSQITTSYSDIW